MKKIYALEILSLLSGIVSASFLDGFGEATTWFFPGLVFGVAGAVYALLLNKRSLLQLVLILVWVVASTASYYAAVYSAIYIAMSEVTGTLYTAFFSAGIIGGFLMLISWCFLIATIRTKFLIFLTVLSGVLGLTPMLFSDPINKTLPLQTLFVVWQLGMGIAMGIAMRYSEKRSAVDQQL
jgi:hypothetical protein